MGCFTFGFPVKPLTWGTLKEDMPVVYTALSIPTEA